MGLRQDPSDAAKVTARLHTLDNDLRRLTQAYNTAWNTWATAGSPLRSPDYDRRRSGKSSSSTPPEAEGRTRTLLNVCAQRLAMSLRVLAKHDWLDAKAWFPESLQRRHVVMRDPWVELPKFKRNGDPDWRDAADVTVQPVDIDRGVAQAPGTVTIDEGVSQLRGIVTALCAVDWSRQDDVDVDTVRDMLHEAEEAVGAVKATGAWKIPLPPPEPDRLCDRNGCWNVVKGRRGPTCGACVQADHRERKKAS